MMSITTKPSIFVGSSVEGLDVAYAIQNELDYSADVTVWPQGVFELNDITVERLVTVARESDLAVFVFTPDDAILLRDSKTSTVRDNVLFEFGLFIGILGIKRTFFLIPRGIDLHIPSNLMGLTPGTYVSDRKDGNLRAAVGPFCKDLKKKFPKPVPFKFPEELVNRWKQLIGEVYAAYRNAIASSESLPYRISESELRGMDIFDLEKLYLKTEFALAIKSCTLSTTALSIYSSGYLERGTAAKLWEIDELNQKEKQLREVLARIRASTAKKA